MKRFTLYILAMLDWHVLDCRWYALCCYIERLYEEVNGPDAVGGC